MVSRSHADRSRRTQKYKIASLACLIQMIPYGLGFALGNQSKTIMQRDTATCPSDDLLSCPAPIPFCCPKGTKCTSLTPDNSSVLCCPHGHNCSIIATVSCDVSLQDPNEHPGALLQTNRLNAHLPICGNACCPLGYTCENSYCVQNDQTQSTTSSSPEASQSSSAGPNPTSSSTISSTTDPIPTKTMHPIIIPTVTPPSSTSEYPVKAVILGLFAGLAGGLLLAALIWYLCKRRRRSRQRPDGPSRSHTRDGSDTDATKPPSYVSGPTIASEYGGGHRTDFLLRTPERQTSLKKPRLTPSPLRPGLPTNPSPAATAPPQRPPRSDDWTAQGRQAGVESIELDDTSKHLPVPAVQTNTHTDLDRHPSDGSYISTGSESDRSRAERGSGETINVLMPPPVMAEGGPNWRGVSTNTTFSAMMERAGMKRGPGFAEYPGRWSFGQR